MRFTPDMVFYLKELILLIFVKEVVRHQTLFGDILIGLQGQRQKQHQKKFVALLGRFDGGKILREVLDKYAGISVIRRKKVIGVSKGFELLLNGKRALRLGRGRESALGADEEKSGQKGGYQGAKLHNFQRI